MNEATQSDAEMGPNPFSVTKAGYFTDAEIHSTWVDWPAPGGFAHLVSVHSRMPRFILGGKGSGRTHMMRHFSAPVQVARGGGDGVRQVQTDGVVGVYIMCSNLDASRFGDGRDDSVSRQFLFTQYMDLWLALADLDAFELLTAAKPLSAKDEKAAASEILELVGADATEEVADLNRVRSVFEQLRRRIDQVVNDSMLNPSTSLEVTAHSSVGRLVFEVPRILKRYYEDLSAVIWLYLIDEHENLGASQQQYINSLVRESVPGVSFAVGVRRYGLRTHTVIGGLEENRRGSEFDEIRLDRVFGGDSDLYRTFCMGIVKRRLTDAGSSSIGNTTEFGHDLVRAFERRDNSWVERQVTARYEPMERPYMLKLKQQLQRYGGSAGDGVLTQTAVDEVLQSVSVPERPMLEKANILLLYREWAAGRDVMEAAEQLRKEQAGVSQTKGDNASDRQRRVLQYFASDLRAQLHRDMRLRGSQYYSGIEEFIRMSDHLPRNLLVILKNVYRWSLFFDERPFAGRPISLEAQRMGAYEAAEWFYDDAKPLGADGEVAHRAVGRMANMFRRLRFSDKPSESSLVGFSTDLSRCSDRTRELVELADKWSLLVSSRLGQKGRNSQLLEDKFHLNRMLCPLWDLPIGRRGAIQLTPGEMDAIFDPEEDERYMVVVKRRLERMTVPFGRAHKGKDAQRAFDLDE